jgi:hypothetical protein
MACPGSGRRHPPRVFKLRPQFDAATKRRGVFFAGI